MSDFAERIDDDYVGEQTFFDSRAVDDQVQDFYFTFGHNHIWPLTGTTLAKSYVKLRGTFDGTRDEMNRRFDNRWSMQYRDKEKAGVDRYQLAELKLEFPDGKVVFL